MGPTPTRPESTILGEVPDQRPPKQSYISPGQVILTHLLSYEQRPAKEITASPSCGSM